MWNYTHSHLVVEVCIQQGTCTSPHPLQGLCLVRCKNRPVDGATICLSSWPLTIQSHLYKGRMSGRTLFLLACIHTVTSCRDGWIFHPSTSSGSFGSSKQAAPCMQARITLAHLFYLGIDDFVDNNSLINSMNLVIWLLLVLWAIYSEISYLAVVHFCDVGFGTVIAHLLLHDQYHKMFFAATAQKRQKWTK